MEDSAAKDQSAAPEKSNSRLLRYPLRSKSMGEKLPTADSSNSNSAARRGRPASSVSKSVGVLDFHIKDKLVKPLPRHRLSVPSKSNASPKSIPNLNSISEARAKGSNENQGKTKKPLSDVSKSSHRKKFNVLFSASYWLTQIKLSESAANHSISLGFFKLALEARCEPMQRISDELKSYVHRHNLSGEIVKELFEIHKISENSEQSQVPTDGNQLSYIIPSSARKVKLKSLDVNATESKGKKASNGITQKHNSPRQAKKTMPKNNAHSKSGSEVRTRNIQKKSQKFMKQESDEDKDKMKEAKESAPEDASQPQDARQENKENMAAHRIEEIASEEV